jgi:Tol biopolymer transport system component
MRWTLLFLVFITSPGYILHTGKNDLPKGWEQDHSAPVIFAKDVISTEDDEFGATFTPDGETCYFVKRTPSTIISSTMVICVSQKKDGKWSKPEIASFSGRYWDFNPCLSPDGQKLFFISNRPLEGKKGFDTDIWVVKRLGDKWSTPENLGSMINTPGWELGCSVTNDGTLYFSTTGASGNEDIYRSRFTDGKYQKPDTLGPAINSPYNETGPFIAPDESYILFSSTGRPDDLTGAGASAEYPRGDLYISFNRNGKWTNAKHLDAPVNSEAEESNPSVSHDGKIFYFTSERNFISIPMKTKLDYSTLEKDLHSTGNGLGDIYEMPANTIINPAQ